MLSKTLVELKILGITALPFHTPEQYGASPSATAAANTTAIQTALTLGGSVVLLTPGVYSISKTLLHPSNTSLTLGPGVQIKLANSADCALIRNTDCQNALIGTGFSVAAGVATVTEKGHSRAVGDSVCIENATGNLAFNAVHTITEVTSTTWKIAMATGAAPTNPATNRVFISVCHPLAGANFVRSASNVVTVTETGHTRQVDDHVYISQLSGAASFNGMATITSQVPGVSWTYANTGGAETATGTANVLGNTGMQLINFRYDGNKSNVANDLYQAFTALYINVGNSVFDFDMATNYWWRGLCLMNAGAVHIPRFNAQNGAVGCQFDSNCDDITIGTIAGRGLSDDILAWGVTGTTGAFGDTACPSGQASMDSLKVSKVHGDSPTGLLKLYCNTGYDLGTVMVGSITGIGRAIASDTTAGVSGGTMTRLVVDHMDCSPASAGQTGISLTGLLSYGDVIIRNAVDNYTSSTTTFFCFVATIVKRLSFENLFAENYGISYSVVHVNSGGDIRSLSITKSRLTAGNGGDCVRVAAGGVVTNLNINNTEFSGSGAAAGANYYGTLVLLQSTGTLKRVILNGIDLTVGQFNTLLNLGGASQTVDVDLTNVVGFDAGSAGKGSTIVTDNSTSTSGNVRFSGLRFATGPANNIFHLSGSGTWVIHGVGFQFVAAKVALLTSGTVNVSINCPEAKIDLGANAAAKPARLIPVAGDQLYNTNAVGPGVYVWSAAGAFVLVG
jgi:hypothetical protein